MATLILTARSRAFRRRASAIGQSLTDDPNQENQLQLVQQALSWIQLAENEETLYADAQKDVDAEMLETAEIAH